MNTTTLRAPFFMFAFAIITAILANTLTIHADYYSLFSNQGITIGQSSTVDGIVASNADISINPFSSFGALTGGGNLLSSVNGSFNVNGDVTFNGNVTTGSGPTIHGTINSGGNVDLFFAQAQTGPIIAAGNVIQGQSAVTNGTIRAGGSFTNAAFSIVNGNVFANTTVNVAGTVNGNVTHGGGLIVGPFGVITGSTPTGVTPVNPAHYSPVSTPAAIPFSSGGAAVISGGSPASPLQPGSYGTLNIPTFGELYLTPGNYYFDSFSFNGNGIHLLNLTPASKINIFVTGDVSENTFSDMTVNGLPFASANPALASNVLLETLGNYSQNPPGLGSVNFFGTIFAPQGNINIGNFSDVTGTLIAGGHIDIGVSFNQITIPSGTVPVPEPAAGACFIGLMSLLLRRRRR